MNAALLRAGIELSSFAWSKRGAPKVSCDPFAGGQLKSLSAVGQRGYEWSMPWGKPL